jgi:GntR family transcriptional regulator, phosphonate transport system regulatory protein
MSVCAINRNSGESVYCQISLILEQEIKSVYEAGDYLPVEIDLAARFSVNRHTLRRAVDELVLKGLVERQHGRGNLILGEALEYKVGEKTRFTERLESLGKLASTKVIRKIVVPAYGGVARRLAIKEDSFVLMIETLRHVDDRPYQVIQRQPPQR